MSNLNRNLAPIPKGAWEFIEEEANEILTAKLAGRKVVDFVGPKGIDYAAVNTGRRVEVDSPVEGVKSSKRQVLPLVEIEIPFKLDLNELEALARGAEDVDSDPVREAAEKVADVENKVIFSGLEDPQIEGILEAADQSPVPANEETGLVSPAAKGITKLVDEGVEGPYNLLLGSELYSLLYKLDGEGYPLYKKLVEMIQGDIISVPELDDKGLLVPVRDGDFELIAGQDLAIGYKQQVGDEVEFFFTESFSFRVYSPEAAIILE
jgi:uncharacterized linocin/CFP29 family protein